MRKWTVSLIILVSLVIGFSFNSFLAAVGEMNPGLSAVIHECCDFRAQHYDINIFVVTPISLLPVILLWMWMELVYWVEPKPSYADLKNSLQRFLVGVFQRE